MAKCRNENNTMEKMKPKKKKPCQRFRPEYSEIWKCLSISRKGDTHDFSCAYGGKFDCKRHVETKSHQDFAKLKNNNTTMKDFCSSTSANASSEINRKRNQTRAELYMCSIIAQMNLSFNSASVLSNAFKDMFPDSKTAAGM